ncbi:MAG: flagella basal body P-ring formation protein FlgA [Myxococcota bacterium]
MASLSAFAIAKCGALQVDVHRLGVSAMASRTAVASSWSGDPCGPRPNLRLTLTDNRGTPRILAVQPSLTIWVEGFVSSASVATGDVVEGHSDRVAFDPREGRPVKQPGPWRARMPLAEGATLTERAVTRLPDAMKGAEVDVVVHRGGIRLSVSGRLLVDGFQGERVRVRHNASDRTVVGHLVNSTTVEIR